MPCGTIRREVAVKEGTKNRSSHRSCSVRKGVLRNFAKLTEKHLYQSLFFNKVAGSATLLKKRLWRKYFPVNVKKFLRTPFLQNTSGRLLLKISFKEKKSSIEREVKYVTEKLAESAAKNIAKEILKKRRVVSVEYKKF